MVQVLLEYAILPLSQVLGFPRVQQLRIVDQFIELAFFKQITIQLLCIFKYKRQIV